MVFEELPEDNALKGVLPAQTDHPRENTDSAKCQSSNFPTSFSGFPFQPSSLDEPCLAVALQPRSPTGQLSLALLASRPVPAEAMLSTTNSPCAYKLFLQLWGGDPCCLHLLMEATAPMTLWIRVMFSMLEMEATPRPSAEI